MIWNFLTSAFLELDNCSVDQQRPCALMRRRPLRLFLVLQLSLHSPVFLLETSQQTDCTSTFVPSPSRSRSLLLFFFLKGGEGGGTQTQPHSVYPTIIPRQRKKISSCEVSSGCICFGTACPCPLDFIHLLGEDGFGAAPAGGNADGQMPRRLSAERCCSPVVHTRRRIQGFGAARWRNHLFTQFSQCQIIGAS